MKLCDFVSPGSVQEARSTLKKLGDKGIPIAGGTALHFMQDHTPIVGVDITRLGLNYIRPEGDYYRIGATTPLADVQRYRANHWALHEICRRIATHQVRNISTIGGNIAHVFPWADLPVILLAMEAVMVIEDEQEYELSADKFFETQPAKLFRSGALLTAVKVPELKAHTGFGSIKEVRVAAGFSMMTAAAVLHLEGAAISRVRVAAGGAIPFPTRLPRVEEALQGKEATDQVFADAVKLIDDIKWRGREGMSDEYARHLAEVALYDALQRAAQFAHGRVS